MIHFVNFNTKKVRLKQTLAERAAEWLAHFNTKKVRLKPTTPSPSGYRTR